MNGLRRDGHLSDLALETCLAGTSLPEVGEHLVECDSCTQRLAFAREEEFVELPALVLASPPEPANRSWRWLVPMVAAAVAVLALPALFQAPTPDGLRVKGAALSLQVFLDAGETSEQLRSGDAVSAGDRLGFRVRHPGAGYLLVYGVDSQQEAYLCYPQSQGGGAAARGASPELQPLPEAVRLDDTLGEERLVAVLCDQAFSLSQVSELPAGCVTDEITLVKR